MGRLFVVTLEGKIYSCKHCRTHISLSEDIVSKVFPFSFFLLVIGLFLFIGSLFVKVVYGF